MLSKSSQSDENKAYHLIQSFLPGEVDFDTAHQIGMELADKILERKYSYVVSTHIDRDHIHNHIIFCAADNIGHHKYNDCKRSYYRIRHLSDELCREHHLSVIVPDGQRGKKYNEWSADKGLRLGQNTQRSASLKGLRKNAGQRKVRFGRRSVNWIS